MNLKPGVKRLCDERGITISQLERMIYPDSTSRGNLHHILNAKKTRSGPKLATLNRIAMALDMKLSDVIKKCEECEA